LFRRKRLYVCCWRGNEWLLNMAVDLFFLPHLLSSSPVAHGLLSGCPSGVSSFLSRAGASDGRGCLSSPLASLLPCRHGTPAGSGTGVLPATTGQPLSFGRGTSRTAPPRHGISANLAGQTTNPCTYYSYDRAAARPATTRGMHFAATACPLLLTYHRLRRAPVTNANAPPAPCSAPLHHRTGNAHMANVLRREDV